MCCKHNSQRWNWHLPLYYVEHLGIFRRGGNADLGMSHHDFGYTASLFLHVGRFRGSARTKIVTKRINRCRRFNSFHGHSFPRVFACTMPWKRLCQIVVRAFPQPATCHELLELSARMILTGQPYLRLLRLALAPDEDVPTIRAICTSEDPNSGAVVSKDRPTSTPCKPFLTTLRRSSLIFPSDLSPSCQVAAEQLSRLAKDASAASPARPVARTPSLGTSPAFTIATPIEPGWMDGTSFEETRHALLEAEQVLRDSIVKIKCAADLCECVSVCRKRKRGGVEDLELSLEKRTKTV